MGTPGLYDRRNTWDTPTLIENWRTGPYLHDGRCATMTEVFTIEKHGLEKETLAIDGTVCGLILHRAFEKANINIMHGKPIMDSARMIKTRDEIELMRITCQNSESAFAAIVEAIRPGIRECDLVGIGIKALYEEGADHTEDLVCCSGFNTNPYGWSFSDKPRDSLAVRRRPSQHLRPESFLPHQDLAKLLVPAQRVAQHFVCDLAVFQEHFTKPLVSNFYVNAIPVPVGDIFNTNVILFLDE